MPESDPATDAPEAPPLQSYDPYAVLRNRDFVFYLIGKFVASLGQQMLSLAVGWEIYHRTHSFKLLGLVSLTQMVPMVLFTLLAGHVADNYSRKRVIVLMSLVITAASSGLAMTSAWQAGVVWTYICLLVIGTAKTFLWPASSAFLPSLVSRSQFSTAVTWNSGAFQLSAVVGPAVAGALISWTGKAALVYAVNAAFSLVFMVLMTFLRQEHIVAVKERLTAFNLIAGFKFVFASPIILGTITLDMFAVLLGGSTALLPVYAEEILHVGPSGLGLLQAALPLGSVFCALFLAHRPPLQKAGHSLLWAVIAFGVATIGFGISKVFWVSLLMLLICGAVDNISVVVRHTLVQLLTPDEKRGRVSAVNSLFIGTSNELGGFESNIVAQWFGPSIGNSVSTGAITSVVAGGFGTIAVVIAVALIWPQIRKYGRLDAA
jgi:MFS family permease